LFHSSTTTLCVADNMPHHPTGVGYLKVLMLDPPSLLLIRTFYTQVYWLLSCLLLLLLLMQVALVILALLSLLVRIAILGVNPLCIEMTWEKKIGTVQLIHKIAVGKMASPKFTLPVREALNPCWLSIP